MGMDGSAEGSGPARRQIPQAVLAGRAARQLVAPVHEKLGNWQAEAIKLETMAQRARATGRHDAGLRESALTLLDYVRDQSASLQQSIGSQPDHVRGHSRVADTLRALELIAERLDRTVSQLGGVRDELR
jgi:hypothetical protein